MVYLSNPILRRIIHSSHTLLILLLQQVANLNLLFPVFPFCLQWLYLPDLELHILFIPFLFPNWHPRT